MDMMNNCLRHGNKSCNSIISSLSTKMFEKNNYSHRFCTNKYMIEHFPINLISFVIDGIKILKKLVFLLQAKIM